MQPWKSEVFLHVICLPEQGADEKTANIIVQLRKQVIWLLNQGFMGHAHMEQYHQLKNADACRDRQQGMGDCGVLH